MGDRPWGPGGVQPGSLLPPGNPPPCLSTTLVHTHAHTHAPALTITPLATRTYSHPHSHSHTSTWAHTHAFMFTTHSHTQAHTPAPVLTHMDTHQGTHLCTHALTHSCLPTHQLSHSHTHALLCTHTPPHTPTTHVLALTSANMHTLALAKWHTHTLKDSHTYLHSHALTGTLTCPPGTTSSSAAGRSRAWWAGGHNRTRAPLSLPAPQPAGLPSTQPAAASSLPQRQCAARTPSSSRLRALGTSPPLPAQLLPPPPRGRSPPSLILLHSLLPGIGSLSRPQALSLHLPGPNIKIPLLTAPPCSQSCPRSVHPRCQPGQAISTAKAVLERTQLHTHHSTPQSPTGTNERA